MRVAHICLSEGLGDNERQTAALLGALGEMGASTGLSHTLIARRARAVHRVCSDMDGLDLRPVRGSCVGAALAARDAHVVHAHGVSSLRAAALASLCDRPLVISQCAAAPAPGDLLSRWAYARADNVTAASQSVADRLPRDLCRHEVAVVHDCATHWPAAAPHPHDDGHDDAYVDVMVASDLDMARGGVDLAIDVARDLARTHPRIRFSIAGAGADQARLHACARHLSNVRFLGPVEDLSEVLDTCDLLLQPAADGEPGAPVLDALAHGVPPVAARAGGIREIVVHNESGLLVEPHSKLAMKRAVAYLAERPGERRRLSRNARVSALSYLPATVAKHYFDTYMHVLSLRRACSGQR